MKRAISPLLFALVGTACADVSQELGPRPDADSGSTTPATTDGAGPTGTGGDAGSGGGDGGDGGGLVPPPPQPASDFEWLAPKPHGNAFRAVAATSDNDLWLGGRREVLAWNGQTWKTHVPAEGDVLYHGLWVRGGGDVWAGGTKLVWREGEQMVLAHLDDGVWSETPELASRRLAALGGTATRGFLALDGGEIRTLEDGAWIVDGTLDDHEVRALSVLDDDRAWAVGDAGLVAMRTATGWTIATDALAGEGDPFASDRHYLGVWAHGDDDAWAVYETAPLDGTDAHEHPEVIGEIGFSHWDGERWSVMQTAPADCSAEMPEVRPSYPNERRAVPAFLTRGAPETRRGSLIDGRSSADVTASVGNGRCVWHYDGTGWSPVVEQYDSFDEGEGLVLSVQFPLGDAPAVASTTSTTFIGARGGQLLAFDPNVDFPPPEPSDETPRSPALSEVFPADRSPVTSLTPNEGAMASIFGGLPAAWSAGGWVPLEGPPDGALDPSVLDGTVEQPILHATEGGALWLFGGGWGNADTAAAKWENGAWSTIDVDPSPDTGNAWPTSAWSAPGSTTVWVATGAYVRRLEGGRMRLVELPPLPAPFDTRTIGTVSGSSDDDVWVTVDLQQTSAPAPPLAKSLGVYHYDGTAFSLVHETAFDGTFAGVPLVAAFGEQAWVIEDGYWDEGQQALRWDGEEWESDDGPAVGVRDLWGRAIDDVYLLGYDLTGSHLFHYDGVAWTHVYSADDLETLEGDASTLWLGGADGATLRATLPDDVQ